MLMLASDTERVGRGRKQQTDRERDKEEERDQ